MTLTTGFFDAVRQYSAQEFARVLRAATSPGVVQGIGNTLAVTAGPGLGVTVDTGFVTILGDWLFNDGVPPFTLALLAADLTNPRIDRIIARLTISTKTVEITKLTGTPAGSPVAPSLTQGSDVYEIPLAQIAVAAGAGSITSGNVTDQRQYAGPTVHDLITSHARSGLTAGQVLRATGPTAFNFGSLLASDLPGVWSFSAATASTANPTTTSTTPVTQSEMTVSVVLNTGDIALVFYQGVALHQTAGSAVNMQLATDVGTLLGNTTMRGVSALANAMIPFTMMGYLVAASTAVHSFTAKWWVDAGTGQLFGVQRGMFVMKIARS